MGRKLEKGKVGEAVQYYSRKQAMRHLQIGLPNFVRLCLWKGIYPSEPTDIRKVSKGDSKQKIYYKRKDINLLLTDPLLGKLREIRAFNVRLKRAKERRDKDQVRRLEKVRPTYTLHHLIREQFPTPEDAMQHLGESLNMICVFAMLPKLTQFPSRLIPLARRLKLEFLNYCIAKQALTHCYISRKGFYFSAELAGGIPVVWLMPHEHVGTSLPPNCEYRMLANQMEFESTLLVVVLRKLYLSANLAYPPQFQLPADTEEGAEFSEHDMLSAMSLACNEGEVDSQLAWVAQFSAMSEDVAAVADTVTRRAALQSLFSGQRVFLSREVGREAFCFALRCCGATVSWDAAGGVGALAPFPEHDDSITIQITDRPLAPAAMRVSRAYVKPQWVFDSVNAARMLPLRDYLPGTPDINHVSPWATIPGSDGNSSGRGHHQHVTHEMRYLRGEIEADQLHTGTAAADDDSCHDDDVDEMETMIKAVENDENSDDEDDEDEEEDEDDNEEMDEDECVDDISEPEEAVVKPVAKPVATKRPRRSREEVHKEAAEGKQRRLLEMSLPKKRLNLYKKMRHAEKADKTRVDKLAEKRRVADSEKRRQTRGRK